MDSSHEDLKLDTDYTYDNQSNETGENSSNLVKINKKISFNNLHLFPALDMIELRKVHSKEIIKK